MKDYYLMVFADNSNMIFERNDFSKKDFMKETKLFKVKDSITIKNLINFQKINYDISLCNTKHIEQIW